MLNGYILAYGSVIMVAGSLVDLIGPRRVWLLGLALFCAATFLLPLASVFWMDVLRLVQGTAARPPRRRHVSLAPLFHGAARARAFSLLGTTFGIGLSFGPLASGWLVEAADGIGCSWPPAWSACWARRWWRPACARRPPACAAGSTGAARCASPARWACSPGMLLAPETGWRSPGVLGSLLASAVLAVAFVRVERRIASPLLELGLFETPASSACGRWPPRPPFFSSR